MATDDPKINVIQFDIQLREHLEQFVTAGLSVDSQTFGEWFTLLDKCIFEEESASNDTVENSRADSRPDQIDHTVVTFGKYKGNTPDQISRLNEGYITWAYENLDRRFCSYTLYKECGGRIGPRWDVDKHNVSTSATNKATGFDDYEDDIPF